MIITPAKFEDAMKEKKTVEEALALMADTLDSLGYAAGLKILFNHLEGTSNDRQGTTDE